MGQRQKAPGHLCRGRVVKPTAVTIGSLVETINGTARVIGLEEGTDRITTRRVRAAILPPDDDRIVQVDLDNGYWCWGYQVYAVRDEDPDAVREWSERARELPACQDEEEQEDEE